MTVKFAIVRSFAFACSLLLAAGSANAQGWFGQRNNDEASDLTVRIQKLVLGDEVFLFDVERRKPRTLEALGNLLKQ